MKRFWCFWLFVSIARVAWAQPDQQPLLVGASALPSGELSLINSLYHLDDSTGQLTIDQAIQLRERGKFRASISPTVRQDFGYNTSVHWLFFDLESVRKADLMLEIEYANIDQVEVFEVNKGQVRSLGLTGDQFNFSQRPYVNNNYVFPLRLPAGSKAGYYLRVDHPNAVLSFFVRLWPRPVFLHTDRNEYFVWGIYIGIICIVLVVTLVMLLATKDRIYLWYALYIHFMTMYMFTDAGLSFQYLWDASPHVNEYMLVYLYVWAAMVTQITFMQFFIHQTRRNSRVFRWLNILKVMVTIALTAAIAVHLLELPGREQYMYQVVAQTTSYLVPVMVILTVMSLYERRHEQDPMVRYYGYALAIQFAGYFLAAIMNFFQTQGWALPFDMATYVVLGLSMLIDLVFFSYGLAYRYSVFRQTNRALELNLLEAKQETQRRVIDSLEDERRRLAQDLHDDVGATLSTAKGYLSMLTRDGKSAPLLRSQSLLDQAAHELRTISHQLMPKHFEQLGLAKAIEETIRKLSGGQTQYEFVSMGQTKRLDAQSEMLVFSMATELLRHVRKRDGATEATVQLIYHTDRLNLTVEDNGQNLNTDDPADGSWRNLHTKAEYLKADLLVDTNEQGHSVILSVPFS